MLKQIVLSFLVACIAIVVFIIVDAQVLVPLTFHGAELCTDVAEGASGCEDAQLVHGDWVLASCADHRLLSQGKADFGSLNRLENGHLIPLKLQDYPHKTFHPHGVYALDTPENGKWIRMFVVNHLDPTAVDGDVVSVFLTDGKVAKLIDTINHPILKHPNDVTAYSEDEIYFTRSNYYGWGSVMGLVEVLTKRTWCYVGRCVRRNGKWECEKVITDLQMPNGIIMSTDRSKLYVVDTLSRLFSVYTRKSASELSLQTSIDVGVGCDNLNINHTNGVVYTACHPRMLTFAVHADDTTGTKHSPTRVVSIAPNSYAFTEELLHNGDSLSAASVVVPMLHSKKVHLGAVFAAGLQDCDLEHVSG